MHLSLEFRSVLISTAFFIAFFLFLGRIQNTLVISEASIIRSKNRLEVANEQLHEKEESLEQAQRLAKIGSWSLDLLENKLVWSAEISNIFGVDSSTFEASYEGFLSAIHPDDLDYVNEQYRGALDGKYPYDIRHRVIRKDNGEVLWVHERCNHIRNEQGEV